MRTSERIEAEEQFEAAGRWKVARHTICRWCQRRKPTDEDRVCRRCAWQTETVASILATFEAVDDEPDAQEELERFYADLQGLGAEDEAA